MLTVILRRFFAKSVVREKSFAAIVLLRVSEIEVAFSSEQFLSKIKNSSSPQRQMISLSRKDRLAIRAISFKTWSPIGLPWLSLIFSENQCQARSHTLLVVSADCRVLALRKTKSKAWRLIRDVSVSVAAVFPMRK